uniref:SVWC-domain containing protein n=1 Tax=Hyalomma asiaticum TaxID=266040 RepID=A0A0G3VRC6_HYAAI|nr:SVWC-domain containing protein [Hyalomma asiaticum]
MKHLMVSLFLCTFLMLFTEAAQADEAGGLGAEKHMESGAEEAEEKYCKYENERIPHLQTAVLGPEHCVTVKCKLGNMEVEECPTLIMKNSKCIKSTGAKTYYPHCCPQILCPITIGNITIPVS